MLFEPNFSYRTIIRQQAWIRGKAEQAAVPAEPARIIDFEYIMLSGVFVLCYRVEYASQRIAYIPQSDWEFCEVLPFGDLAP